MSRRSKRDPTPAARLLAEPRWREAERLFDQQVWCLGRDVAEIPGNGLVRRGLARHPPPCTVYHHSYYDGTVGDADVVLWSWGLYHRVPGRPAILLRRARLEPLFVDADDPPDGVWCSDLIAGRRLAESDDDVERFLAAAAVAFDWLAEHERWVLREVGPAHRESAVARWTRAVAQAEDMATRWNELAAWCRHEVSDGRASPDASKRETA